MRYLVNHYLFIFWFISVKICLSDMHHKAIAVSEDFLQKQPMRDGNANKFSQ